MPHEREIELKTLVSKHTFDYLYNHFSDQLTHITQTNHYFDTTEGTLHLHHQALRVRQTEQENVVTLKTKLDDFTAHEITVAHDGNLITTIQKSSDLIEALPCSAEKLIKIAHFTTHRSFLPLTFGILFLDFTQYDNNLFDYELEIEVFHSNDISLAHSWFSEYAIDYVVAPPKIARAIASQ